MDLSKIPREPDSSDLHLRPSAMADAKGMFAMLSDPAMSRESAPRCYNCGVSRAAGPADGTRLVRIA